MSIPSGLELLLIFGIIVLLFGTKKIPDLVKGIGRGIRCFKKEIKEKGPIIVGLTPYILKDNKVIATASTSQKPLKTESASN